jgi:hypothetical protein
MAKTIRDRYIEAIYQQYPNCKHVNTAVEAMVDWYLTNEKDFKKTMKRLETEAAKDVVQELPKREIVVECISKKDADQEDSVPDDTQQQEGGGATIELLGDHS